MYILLIISYLTYIYMSSNPCIVRKVLLLLVLEALAARI